MKLFGQRKFGFPCTGTKVPQWQSDYFFCQRAILELLFKNSKTFFLPNDFLLSIMKDILHAFAQKKFSGLVQGCPCTYPRERLRFFQVFLIGFRKFFLFWNSLVISSQCVHIMFQSHCKKDLSIRQIGIFLINRWSIRWCGGIILE